MPPSDPPRRPLPPLLLYLDLVLFLLAMAEVIPIWAHELLLAIHFEYKLVLYLRSSS